MRLTLLRHDCDTGRTCPQIHLTDQCTYAVQGYLVAPRAAAAAGLSVSAGDIVVELPAKLLPELEAASPALRPTARGTVLASGPPLTDAEALAELAVPEGEAVIELPFEALPDLDVVLDEQQLGAFIDGRFTSELFRLETLDHYEVGGDGDDLAAYIQGRPGPDMARKGPWLDVIRSEVERGLHTYRVHVVRSPLTPYLRFEMEWGYRHNAAAGEHIGIVDLAEQDAPEGLVDRDFWLIAGDGGPDRVVVMDYDDAGRFRGARVAPDAEVDRYRRARAAAWDAAVPFGQYWRSHPQFWRDHRTAA
ncbi:DUF6879 family protein [Actinomadura citrea]|uniref:DUF6879 family protein n=1 Tax=Actinomadura citrea TaxID=46158 RepID=UPI003CE4B2E0